MVTELSPELISLVAGAAWSLIASYLPGARAWFEGLTPDQKRGVMAVLMAVTSIGVYIADCYAVVVSGACGSPWSLVGMFFLALIANQSTYSITP